MPNDPTGQGGWPSGPPRRTVDPTRPVPDSEPEPLPVPVEVVDSLLRDPSGFREIEGPLSGEVL